MMKILSPVVCHSTMWKGKYNVESSDTGSEYLYINSQRYEDYRMQILIRLEAKGYWGKYRFYIYKAKC